MVYSDWFFAVHTIRRHYNNNINKEINAKIVRVKKPSEEITYHYLQLCFIVSKCNKEIKFNVKDKIPIKENYC